jgi:hypothetical protein
MSDVSQPMIDVSQAMADQNKVLSQNHFVTTGSGASTGGGALPLPMYTAFC